MIKCEEKEQKIKENLVQIFHRFKNNYPPDHFQSEFDLLFSYQNYSYIKTYRDFIILSNKNSIKPVNLYEMLWEKYTYFLDTPAKYEPYLWWKPYTHSSKNIAEMDNNSLNNKSNNTNHKSTYLPFTIKIIKKSTKGCIFCPWFLFCT